MIQTEAPPLKTGTRVLPAARRFTVLDSYGGQAVRDNETGLVWEKALTGGNGILWSTASYACIEKKIGGRKAWRLPSIAELLSLIDTNQANPALPPGTSGSNAGYLTGGLSPTGTFIKQSC